MSIDDKISIVKNLLKDKKVAIGFSGGADSTLIAYLSSKVAKDTMAITIDNHLLPTGFVENTKRIAESFGIKHKIIDIDFYEDESFLNNDSARCYTCRNMMYSKIEEIAQENDYNFICDGNNISDLVIDRPGILITYKKKFKSPFIEAKLTSKEIHEYMSDNNIPYSKSTTCLATRLPTDTQTTQEKIERIRCCEDYIQANTCCEIVKVRDLGELGIVEVDKLKELLVDNKFININNELKSKGFKKIALNLSEIDDDEFIHINYENNSFTYQLPFTINLEDTKKQLNEVIFEDKEKIEVKNFEIFRNGLIKGHGLKTYDLALNKFMEILSKLRRNV